MLFITYEKKQIIYNIQFDNDLAFVCRQIYHLKNNTLSFHQKDKSANTNIYKTTFYTYQIHFSCIKVIFHTSNVHLNLHITV